MAPPTIHQQPNSSQVKSSSSRRKEEKPADLNCKIRYNNTLPDIPFDPKFLAYPFDRERFVAYRPTSLEQNFKFELLCEADLGVKIDLINPEAYVCPPNAIADPDDEKLLEDDAPAGTEARRSRQHNKVVPWLRRTEYISSEFNRYGVSNERHESKVGYHLKKQIQNDEVYKDRASQIEAIAKTFEQVAAPTREHYSKPGVFAVNELPIFPDFDLWRIACAQVIFDADPTPHGSTSAVVNEAIIRGMMDQAGEQFVAYFLPNEETSRKRKRDDDEGVEYQPDETYEYKLAREYNWNVKNKASKGYEENYFFVFREDAVYYNELETRVRLSKRRAREGFRIGNTRLLLKHRQLNEQEMGAQEARMTQLSNEDVVEDADDAEIAEDEAEVEEEAKTSDVDNEDKDVAEREKSDSPKEDAEDDGKADEDDVTSVKDGVTKPDDDESDVASEESELEDESDDEAAQKSSHDEDNDD